MINRNVAVFEFEELAVRIMDQDGAPWFVLVDVCRALDIANSRHASSRLDDDEKDGVVTNDTIGRPNQKLTIISESGLYSLIMSSRKPEAKRFRKWVTSEVIPAIRRTGRYIAPATDVFDDGAVDCTDPVEALGTDRTRVWIDIIREARRLAGAPAGLALWRRSPLPQFPATAAEENGDSHSDEVSEFMSDRTEAADGASVQASVMYGEYCTWAAAGNRVAISNKAFAKKLLAMGVARVERAQGRFWLDRRLADA